MGIFAYRHKENKDVYLIRMISEETNKTGKAIFRGTTDPSLAIYAYSIDSDNYDYFVKNHPSDEHVFYIEEKEFIIDGFKGILTRNTKYTLNEFEKVEFIINE